MPPGSAICSKARGDVDSIAVNVAVVLDDDVADVDADAQLQGLGVAGFALRGALLDGDRGAHGLDGACELGEEAVAHRLHEASGMLAERHLDHLLAEGADAGVRPFLVTLHEA